MKTYIEITSFKFPVFGGTVKVIVTNSIPNAIDFMEDKISQSIHDPETVKFTRAYVYAFQNENNRSIYMIFLKPHATPGEIAHEVKHVLNLMFRWHGQKLSTDNDEWECYYLEDIINRVHRCILKYRKKYNKKKKSLKTLDKNTETPIFES
jgi:hypothetical protein